MESIAIACIAMLMPTPRQCGLLQLERHIIIPKLLAAS